MNAYHLECALKQLRWRELRRVARALSLDEHGGRLHIIERVLYLHSHPPEALRVWDEVREIQEEQQTKKRKRKAGEDEKTVYRSLESAFDEAADADGVARTMAHMVTLLSTSDSPGTLIHVKNQQLMSPPVLLTRT